MNISSLAANSTQELLETAAQTKAEALKGDQQATRRLAKVLAAAPQTAQTPSSPVEAPVTEAPVASGIVLNVKA